MFNKKKLFGLLTMAAAALTVASCDGDTDGGDNKAVEITFWHTMGQTLQDELDTYITAFNQIYPNITITHTSQGGYDDLKSSISTNIAAGTVPTMAYCYPDHVAEYIAANNQVVELTSYIEDSELGFGASDTKLGDLGKDDFIQTFWDEGTEYSLNGVPLDGIYSLPYAKSTEVMFYNKTYFDEHNLSVPTSWEQMWNVCAQIKALEATNESFVAPLGYDSDANMLITLFEQYGIPYTTNTPEDGGSYFLFNNDDAKNMVTTLKGYYDKGYFITEGTSANSSYTSDQFTEQSLFMTIGSTGGTTYNYSSDFEIGVAAIPQADVNNGKVIMQGPSICFFSRATTAQKRAAWLFYKFITNTDNSANWSVITGYNPVRTSSFSSVTYTSQGDNAIGAGQLVAKTAEFLADEDNGYTSWYFTSPAFKGSSVAREQMGGVLSSVCLGTATVDEAFATAMTECTNAL